MALSEWALGRWQDALAHLQQARTREPRSVATATVLAQFLLWLRQYPQAREAADRALALDPTNLDVIEVSAMISLAQGQLGEARAVISGVSNEVDPAGLVAFFAYAFDLYWVLDEDHQARLLRLTPDAFDDDPGGWAIVMAQTYALRGQPDRARGYADSARLAFEEHLRAAPLDAQLPVLLGLALAYLGRKDEAVREALRGVALLARQEDAPRSHYIRHQLARIYLLVGEPAKALDELEPLLSIPYYLSPGWLRIDPTFDPLRGDPRFQRLVAGRP